LPAHLEPPEIADPSFSPSRQLKLRAQPIAKSSHPAFPENPKKPLKFSNFEADKGRRGKMPSRQAHSLRA